MIKYAIFQEENVTVKIFITFENILEFDNSLLLELKSMIFLRRYLLRSGFPTYYTFCM